ncbi:MAG: pyridoxamine 5'-phosphate oxidase [Actinomycetota bacterium]
MVAETLSVRLARLRREYSAAGLAVSDLDPDPVPQFTAWFDTAVETGISEPNAMTLATASRAGVPSARTVLLKGYDERGFVFFTNYTSRKGSELAANPQAALVFPWIQLQRQVIVIGAAKRVRRAESAAYFATRPRGAQISAWASAQSAVITGRSALLAARDEIEQRYADRAVPLPPTWGGVRVVPRTIEFWQGRADRTHDRLRYRRSKGGWVIERLAP